ncbi:MAG: SpoIVB peptidase [Oscillospiraceae bacterium]|nr:SpoIVB peptidase [Oscillospiraceae bacterium]
MKKLERASVAALLLGLLTFTPPAALALEAETLVPVGSAVGIRMETDGVMVAGLTDVETADGTVSPAREAGLQAGDIIKRIGARTTDSAAAFLAAVAALDGEPLDVTATRDGQELTVQITPALRADGAYQLGLWLRDGISGIGTVTFYDPASGTFGALGHGVSDLDTGALLPFDNGSITGASVVDVVPGSPGAPGELCGEFAEDTVLGTLEKNTDSGIFGIASWEIEGAAVPVADKDEVHLGPAVILSDVGSGGAAEYEVEISRVYQNSGDNRFLLLTVTDEALLAATGGIVQGMSGSPILQDGKIVGAVTHVCVNE